MREKALSPKVLRRDDGMVRVRVEEDRRAREGRWGMRRSDRYDVGCAAQLVLQYDAEVHRSW